MNKTMIIITPIFTLIIVGCIIGIIMGVSNLKNGCKELKCQGVMTTNDGCLVRDIESNKTCISHEEKWFKKCENGKIEKCYEDGDPGSDGEFECFPLIC